MRNNSPNTKQSGQVPGSPTEKTDPILDLMERMVKSVMPNSDGLREVDFRANLPKEIPSEDQLLDTQRIIEIETEINDPMRGLKNIATDFVVNEFFQTDESLYRFMALVYNFMDKLLEVYRKERQLSSRDVFFIYKGGNVLRLISSEFMLELPANATREINDFYSPFFKRSDADFSIYINPKLDSIQTENGNNLYEEVFYELGMLSYLAQVRIRNEFMKDPSKYFDFSKYSNDTSNPVKQDILREYLDQFNTVSPNPLIGISLYDTGVDNDGNSKPYTSMSDLSIQFLFDDFGNLSRQAIISNLDQHAYPMTISYNTALDFPSGGFKERRTKFTLVRTKLIFNLFEQSGDVINIGGELIDISISHKSNTGIDHFFDNLNDYVASYKLTYKNTALFFKSYSLAYLIEDLETILFLFNIFPWEDNKYSKRINRLFYLYFIDIFIKKNNGPDRLDVLNNFVSSILDVLLRNMGQLLVVKGEVYKILNQYKSRYNDLFIAELTVYLSKLIEKLKNDEQVGEFSKMISLLKTNVEFLTNTINNIRQYCSVDGKVNVKDIYSTDSKILL